MTTKPECRKWTITLTSSEYGWSWVAESGYDSVYSTLSGGMPFTKWGARREAKKKIRKAWPKPITRKPYKSKTKEYEVCL